MQVRPEKFDSSVLRRKIFRIERLAAMPQVIWQLLQLIGDENTSITKLEKLIESDPALASKMLRLANSVYYGQSQKITTIKRSIVVIGFNELQLLAVSAGLAEIFDLKRVPRGFDGQGLWYHCLAVSWMARELAEAARYPQPNEVLVAGLLHDLGKLILAAHLQEVFSLLLERVEHGWLYYEAEETLGLKHTTLGYWLASKWQLPDLYTAAVRDHHLPLESDPFFTTSCLVLLADQMVKRLGFGLVHEARQVDPRTALIATRLSPERLQDVSRKAESHIPPLIDFWRNMETGD